MKPAPSLVEQQRLIMAYAHKRAPRPILVGDVALMLGWWATLRGTEQQLDSMVNQGLLRAATLAECHTYDVRQGYFPV